MLNSPQHQQTQKAETNWNQTTPENNPQSPNTCHQSDLPKRSRLEFYRWVNQGKGKLHHPGSLSVPMAEQGLEATLKTPWPSPLLLWECELNTQVPRLSSCFISKDFPDVQGKYACMERRQGYKRDSLFLHESGRWTSSSQSDLSAYIVT